MKAYQIIAEIRKDCPVKPFPYLLDRPNSIESLRDYCGESNNKARCWDLIDLTDNLLLCKLSIGLFVAAKDGKPLEVPTMDAIRKENPLHTPWDLLLINRQREYNEAQQHVIFEGWEVRLDSNSDIVIRNGDLRLVFIRITDEKHLSIALYRKKESLGRVQSLADLAEATQSNPLKLK